MVYYWWAGYGPLFASLLAQASLERDALAAAFTGCHGIYTQKQKRNDDEGGGYMGCRADERSFVPGAFSPGVVDLDGPLLLPLRRWKTLTCMREEEKCAKVEEDDCV